MKASLALASVVVVITVFFIGALCLQAQQDLYNRTVAYEGGKQAAVCPVARQNPHEKGTILWRVWKQGYEDGVKARQQYRWD